MPIDPGTIAFTAGTSAASTFAIDAAEDKIVGAKAINGIDQRDKFAMHQLHLERSMQQQMARNPIKNSKTANNSQGFAGTASQVATQQTPMNSIQQFERKQSIQKANRERARSLANYRG
ncbi:MAG: hypothetical protein HRT47_07180 [Candidatus Caenarcaniphilales bacterium]|nr:hypothetical protein [Candidatus Caenarcaniphilales bacterium]